MSFMEMMKEWLDLRDSFKEDDYYAMRPVGEREARDRMDELSHEIDKRMRGEL